LTRSLTSLPGCRQSRGGNQRTKRTSLASTTKRGRRISGYRYKKQTQKKPPQKKNTPKTPQTKKKKPTNVGKSFLASGLSRKRKGGLVSVGPEKKRQHNSLPEGKGTLRKQEHIEKKDKTGGGRWRPGGTPTEDEGGVV